MNSAQSETGSSGSGSSGEELDVVLGRFQNWAATQRVQPAGGPTKSTTGVGLPRDAREVSYEQALRASSYRRPSDPASLDPLLTDVSERAAAQKQDQEKAARTADGPHIADELTPRLAQPYWQERRFVETARAIALEPAGLGEAGQPATRQIQMDGMIPTAPFPRADQTLHPEKRNVSSGAGLTGVTISGQKPAPDAVRTKSNPSASAAKKQPPRTQPAFRDVLKGTAALVAASQGGVGTLERGKTTSLTLRVSDGEQARIQACAAQANLSVSAYLRQCALGVDELRDQVEMALAQLHEQQMRADPPPGLSAIPAILGRFAIKCIRRIRGQSDDYTVVSIR